MLRERKARLAGVHNSPEVVKRIMGDAATPGLAAVQPPELPHHGKTSHLLVSMHNAGAASWYTGGACWRYRGDAALRRVLRGLRRRYGRVAFVGDSMGGSAALRYAQYAESDLQLLCDGIAAALPVHCPLLHNPPQITP